MSQIQQQLLDFGYHKLHMAIEVSLINSSCLTLVIISLIWILKCLRSEQLLALGYYKLHMAIEVSKIQQQLLDLGYHKLRGLVHLKLI